MDQQGLPEHTGSADFARWADEHFEQLLACAAAFFPDSLRKCPLVGDAVDGALEALKAGAAGGARSGGCCGNTPTTSWSAC